MYGRLFLAGCASFPKQIGVLNCSKMAEKATPTENPFSNLKLSSWEPLK